MESKWSVGDADIVRTMIFKENELINDRLTWLVTVQGLLFAALGFAWGKAGALTALLGGVGIVVSISSFVGLMMAQQAVNELKKKWDHHKPDHYVGPDIIGLRSWSGGPVLGFLAPWFILPLLFLAAWILVLAMSGKC
jgi:hypothetical protein